jgi:tetratricopeptide (TPR) repeat protein
VIWANLGVARAAEGKRAWAEQYFDVAEALCRAAPELGNPHPGIDIRRRKRGPRGGGMATSGGDNDDIHDDDNDPPAGDDGASNHHLINSNTGNAGAAAAAANAAQREAEHRSIEMQRMFHECAVASMRASALAGSSPDPALGVSLWSKMTEKYGDVSPNTWVELSRAHRAVIAVTEDYDRDIGSTAPPSSPLAAEAAARAAELAPSDSLAWHALGLAESQRGNFAKAKTCFGKGLARNDAVLPSLVNAGVISCILGADCWCARIGFFFFFFFGGGLDDLYVF